jgi:hypothetical protein
MYSENSTDTTGAHVIKGYCHHTPVKKQSIPTLHNLRTALCLGGLSTSPFRERSFLSVSLGKAPHIGQHIESHLSFKNADSDEPAWKQNACNTLVKTKDIGPQTWPSFPVHSHPSILRNLRDKGCHDSSSSKTMLLLLQVWSTHQQHQHQLELVR